MFAENCDKRMRDIVVFLAWAFGLGWLFQCLGIWTAPQGGAPGAVWLGATMWAPALAALLVGPESRRRIKSQVKRGGLRSWLPGLALGVSFLVLEQTLLVVCGRGHWNEALFPLSADGSGIGGVHRVAMTLGVSAQSFGYFALNLVVSVCLSAVLFMPFSGLGEEAGWRGFLQPALAERFGATKGTVLVGLIWAYWHIPVNMAGYNDATHPWLSTFVLFPVFCVAFAFALGWLTKRSGSLWPAALAHTANNTLSGGLLIVPDSWWSGQAANLVAAVFVGLFAVWLYRRSGRGAELKR